ncbi:MAG: hypothetical protein ACTSXT_01420 [Candidatus Helarchaeota archaeon]
MAKQIFKGYMEGIGEKKIYIIINGVKYQVLKLKEALKNYNKKG